MPCSSMSILNHRGHTPPLSSNNMNDEAKYEADQIQDNLIGFTIEGAIHDDTNNMFGFIASNGSKTFRVWVDRDPEGNGCGHLSLEKA